MKIALIGYGKMGQKIANLAPSMNLEVCAIIDPHHPDATAKELNADTLNEAQVCIDFTTPQSVKSNIETLAKFNKSMVIGTTGYSFDTAKLEALARKQQIGILSSSNFSIGVHLFSKLVEYAAMLVEPFEEFDLNMSETHHIHKKDAPSGTALTLADKILARIKRKQSLSFEEQTQSSQLQIISKRMGEVIGEHSLHLFSTHDQIELSHRCEDRKSFAQGALQAALWLNQKVGYYTFDEMIESTLHGT